MKFLVASVESIGTRKARGFAHHADGSVSTEWDEKVYPDSPESDAFRETRRETMGLREAANLLELRPEVVSGLEFGRYAFADPADWGRASDLLRKNATRKKLPDQQLPTPWPDDTDLPG